MMLWQNMVQFVLFFILLLIISYTLSHYIYKIFHFEKTFLSPMLKPLENLIYKIAHIDEDEQQNWKKYSLNLILFSVFCFIFTEIILHYQSIFPLNPKNFGSLSQSLTINIASSYLTSTNWQPYSGESTLSYFSQMAALTPMSFLGSAIGIAALFAVIRGLTQEKKDGLGNFAVDLTRICLYLLLPLCLILSVFYISQGMIQNFLPYITISTLEGGTQILPQGPVASQVAIKMLGSNGGGFFGTNAAFPFENTSNFSNFIQMLSAVLIPSALVFMFGKSANHKKHAIALWLTMVLLFVIGTVLIQKFEYEGNNILSSQLHLNSLQNLEGKELRFGLFNSSFFTNLSTATSLGASTIANASLVPMSIFITMFNMMMNEIIFGGVGTGLISMIIFVILSVFIAGLMVGRTPEYLGKKIESNEIKLTLYPIIGVSSLILIMTAIACLLSPILSTVGHTGARGFSQILYAFTSTTQNNGSSLWLLNPNTNFWNYSTSICMIFGRYLNIIPMIALASSMAIKKIRQEDDSTFSIQNGLFVTLLIGFIIVFGALSYLPSLAIGPISEHLYLIHEKLSLARLNP